MQVNGRLIEVYDGHNKNHVVWSEHECTNLEALRSKVRTYDGGFCVGRSQIWAGQQYQGMVQITSNDFLMKWFRVITLHEAL